MFRLGANYDGASSQIQIRLTGFSSTASSLDVGRVVCGLSATRAGVWR